MDTLLDVQLILAAFSVWCVAFAAGLWLLQRTALYGGARRR